MPSFADLSPCDSHPLVASQLPSWYPHHKEHSLKSIIIPLPSDFLQFLQEDGVFLPDGSAAVPPLAELDAALLVEGDYRRDDWDTAPGGRAAAVPPHPSPSGPLHSGRDGLLSGSPHSSDQDNTQQEPGGSRRARDGMLGGDDSGSDSGSEALAREVDWTARFPQLRASLDSAISSLGGRVVPKLNWSCPSDAVWMNANGTLTCRNADQVVLLLKSSDRVAHDVALLEAAAEAGAETGSRTAPADVSQPASAATPGQQRPPPQIPQMPLVTQQQASASACGLGGSAEAQDSQGEVEVASTTSQCDQGGASRRGQQEGEADRGKGSRKGPLEGGSGGGEGEGWCGAAAAAAAGPGPGSSGLRASIGGRGVALLQPVLVLKKWYNLRPDREFRCFVRGGALVAASQRDVSQAFPGLTRGAVAEVKQRLWSFWQEQMRGSLPLRDFAFDVYVPSETTSGVRLVDVNPLTDTTSPGLYEWAELGFAPAAVPPAEALLERLLGSRLQGAPPAPGEETAGSGGGSDGDSWMEEAVGLSALPLPSNAQELQVRIVEGPSRGATAGEAAGPGGEAAEAAAGGLGGLVGPMLLGSRAALAMPYDMLGIADSVDKMIEVMQRQEQRRRQERVQRDPGSDEEEESEEEERQEEERQEDPLNGVDDGSHGQGRGDVVPKRLLHPGRVGAAGPTSGPMGPQVGVQGGSECGVEVGGGGPSAAELAAVFGSPGRAGSDDLGAVAGLQAGLEDLQAQAADVMALLEGPTEQASG